MNLKLSDGTSWPDPRGLGFAEHDLRYGGPDVPPSVREHNKTGLTPATLSLESLLLGASVIAAYRSLVLDGTVVEQVRRLRELRKRAAEPVCPTCGHVESDHRPQLDGGACGAPVGEGRCGCVR